jgi:hypothetical protein
MKKLQSICLMLLCLSAINAKAAISDVKYFMNYNQSTCRYDVFMIVENGSVSAGAGQSASTNQVTIVVPAGSTVGTSSITSNEPKSGTRSGSVVTRTSAVNWTNSNTTLSAAAPAALTGKDIYAFTANPSSAYWDVLSAGDTVLMFSIPITNTFCGNGVRLWNNNEIQGTTVTTGSPDPASSAFAGGEQYNNGMGIGSGNQIYNGNGISSTSLPKPVLSSISANCTSNSFGLSANATSGACATSTINYSWVGPSFSFSSNTVSSFTINNPTTANTGVYTLTVTNSNGCTVSQATTVLDVACNVVTLPIKLKSFDAKAQQCNAVLAWTVEANEDDYQRFDVQYSKDGKQFMTVGEVARNHYNEDYSFTYAQNSNKGYYRLRVIALDGGISFSQIVSVNTSCATDMVSISPNPTAGVCTINGVSGGDVVKVMDMLGNTITTISVEGASANIDLHSYPSGVYNVMVIRDQVVVKATRLTRQ